MNKNSKSTLFRFNNVPVIWANLHEPDEFRGSTKHDISFIISDEQMAEMNEAVGAAPGSIKGIRTGTEGDVIGKAKTTVFTKRGETKFTKIFDAEPKQVDVRIGRGDTVNVNVSIYEYDQGTYTLLLNGVQLIAKNPDFTGGASNGSGFGSVDGGFTSSSAPASTEGASAPVDDASSPAVLDDVDEELPF